jgi:aldehyde dehydrogenase (NAD+)
MRHYGKFYIGGEWVEPTELRQIELVNPATEEVYATLALGSAADVDRAVAAARAAFPDFSQSTKTDRINLFRRIMSSYRDRLQDFASAIVQELGAPKSVTIHTNGPLQIFEQTIDLIEEYDFEVIEKGTLIRRESIGCRLDYPLELAGPIYLREAVFSAGSGLPHSLEAIRVFVDKRSSPGRGARRRGCACGGIQYCVRRRSHRRAYDQRSFRH